MKRSIRVLALCSILVSAGVATDACSSTEPRAPAPDNGPVLDLTWLRANASRIRTPDPDDDFSDLEPLVKMIGDARVVALGEDSHGTHEFFAMKDRLVRFLEQRMGFNTFAMEASWAESNRINDYVLGSSADVHVLLSDLYFWTWNTQEVVDMIEWMRVHNANPGSAPRVNFYGFDMQFSRVPMNDVDAYLGATSPTLQAIERSQYACYRVYEDSVGSNHPVYLNAGAPCTTGVDSVYSLLVNNAAALVSAGGQTSYDHALRAARVVVQNEQLSCCSYNASLRDMYMAENAEWLLDQAGPNAKIILWAHNGHINTVNYAMGNFLRTKYGSSYVPLGFSFDSGSYNTTNSSQPFVISVRPVAVTPAPSGTYEWQFSHTGLSGFLVDLRPAKSLATSDPGAWINGPLGFRTFDESFTGDPAPNQPYPTYLPRLFDLLIFFQASSPSTLLPFKYY